MPCLSCAVGVFLSLFFSRASGMIYSKVLFLPSPHPCPLLAFHSHGLCNVFPLTESVEEGV